MSTKERYRCIPKVNIHKQKAQTFIKPFNAKENSLTYTNKPITEVANNTLNNSNTDEYWKNNRL